MKTCDTQHKEIQYKDGICPVCELLAKNDNAEMVKKEKSEQALKEARAQLKAESPDWRMDRVDKLIHERLIELDPEFMAGLVIV